MFSSVSSQLTSSLPSDSFTPLPTAPAKDPTREAFGDFVGQTLFGSMLATMRESVGKPAYFHGGRTEEVFQKQLDQHLVEAITDASSDRFVDPMYQLFQMQRHQ